MAVDIRIEIFAVDLFQQLFKDPVAKYASKEVFPKIYNYSEETLKTSGCNRDVLEAVYLYRRMFRNVYSLNVNDYFEGMITNDQDFGSEIRHFCKDIFFSYGNVFDKIFATAALVYDIGLKCILIGNESYVDLCPLCWAMCFDSEIKDDFYDKGGWDALFQKASAYKNAFKVTTMYLESASEVTDTIEMVLVVSDFFRLVLLMVSQFDEYFTFTKHLWHPLVLELARCVNKLIKLTAFLNEQVPCKDFTEAKFNIVLYFTLLCNYCKMEKFLDFKKKSAHLCDVLSKLELSLKRSDDHQNPTSKDCSKIFWIYSGLYNGTPLFNFTDVTLIDDILKELFSSEDYEPDYDIEYEREMLHAILVQKGDTSQNITTYLSKASICTNSYQVPAGSSSYNLTNKNDSLVSATDSILATGPVIEFSSDDDDSSTQVSSSSRFSVELFSDEETGSHGGQKSYFEKSDPSRKLYCKFGGMSANPGTSGQYNVECAETASAMPIEIPDKSPEGKNLITGNNNSPDSGKNITHAKENVTASSEDKCNSRDLNASDHKMLESDNLDDRNSMHLDKPDLKLDTCFSEVRIFPDTSPIKSQLSFVTKTYSRTGDVGPLKIPPVAKNISKLLATIRTDLRNLSAQIELNDRMGDFSDSSDEPSSPNSNAPIANASLDCKNSSLVEDNLKSPSQMSIATDVSSESECVIIEVDKNNDQKLFRVPKTTNSNKTKSETSSNSCSFVASQSEHNASQQFSAMSLDDELRKFASAGNNLSSRLSIFKSSPGDSGLLKKPLRPITPPLPSEEIVSVESQSEQAFHQFSAMSLNDELRKFASIGNNLSSRLSIFKSSSLDSSPLIKPLQPITPPLPSEGNVFTEDQSLRSPKSFEKDQGSPYHRNKKSSPKVDEMKAKRKLLMDKSEETISAKEKTNLTDVASETQPKQSSIFRLDQPSTSTNMCHSRPPKPFVYEHDVNQPSTSTGVFASEARPCFCGHDVYQPSTSTSGFGSMPSAEFSSKPQTKKQKKSKKSRARSRVKSPTAVDALEHFKNIDVIDAQNKFITELLILGIKDS